MILGLSGLTRAELLRILRQMKKLCLKEEQDALELLDLELNSVNKLINEAREADHKNEEFRSERAHAKLEIENFESNLKRAELLLTDVGRRNSHYPTRATDFETDVTSLGNEWSDETKKMFEQKIEDLKSRAFEFAKAYRRQTIERSQEQLKEMELSLDGSATENVWELPNAEQFIHQLDFSWDEELKKLHSAEYLRLKSQAKEIENRALEVFHMKALAAASDVTSISLARIKSLLRKLQAAESFFKKQGDLNNELAARFRAAWETLAWQRARKMLDDAEVAEAGGNTKKYLKLRAQAKVALRQDWVRIFGQKALPDFDLMPEFNGA